VSNLPDTISDDLMVGLEDFGAADEQIPRLRIVQNKGVFKDNLTGEEFDTLTGVCLGLVRQRVLFHHIVDEVEGPLCRSSNFVEGSPYRKHFPWDDAGFDNSDYDVNDRLPCEQCKLKDWGSHPERDTPYCSEQFTLPFIREHADGSAAPTIVSFQKSSVKPVKGYLSGFKQKGVPTFTNRTEVKLTLAKRGNVDYSVAEFTVGDPTDIEDHPHYADTFLNIRSFLHSSGTGTQKAAELPKGAPTTTTDEEDPF
jgi:hypothetical protein